MQIRLGTLNAWALPEPLATDVSARIRAIGARAPLVPAHIMRQPGNTFVLTFEEPIYTDEMADDEELASSGSLKSKHLLIIAVAAIAVVV